MAGRPERSAVTHPQTEGDMMPAEREPKRCNWNCTHCHMHSVSFKYEPWTVEMWKRGEPAPENEPLCQHAYCTHEKLGTATLPFFTGDDALIVPVEWDAVCLLEAGNGLQDSLF